MRIKKIINHLIENNITISSIESFTGGGFANKITNVKGVSKIYKGSIITYSNEQKIQLLKINENEIKKYTACSKEISLYMVKSGYDIFKTDIVVSFSGYASKDKQNKINNLSAHLWIKFKKQYLYININKKYMSRIRFKNYVIRNIFKKISLLIKKREFSFYT